MSHEIRQGDVLLRPMSAEPPEKRLVARNKVVLALGEVTGHAHTIEAEGVALFETPTGERVVWVESPTTIRHAEHDFKAATGVAEVVAPGWYEVVQQVEDDPLAGIRAVSD